MARSVAVIQAQINAFIAANSNLTYQDENNITRNITYNTSKRSFWNSLTFIIASGIAVVEQLIDLYQAFIEGEIAKSAAASILWIQAKMFAFQYDANDPQVLQLIDTVLQYPVVDTTKQIITGCAVYSYTPSVITIKVAKGNPFAPLDAITELPAASAYINLLGDAGLIYTVISQNADKVYLAADVFYNAQYSAVIKANVITAINNFFTQLSQLNLGAGLNPNGILKVSDLENTIRNVVGVNDVVIRTLVGRIDNPAGGYPLPADPSNNPLGISMVVNRQVQPGNQQYNPQPGAGYMIAETAANFGLADTPTIGPNTGVANLNMIAQ